MAQKEKMYLIAFIWCWLYAMSTDVVAARVIFFIASSVLGYLFVTEEE